MIPGRTCPSSYGYRPEVLANAPSLAADTLYVVGGLYGNLQALAEALALKRAEEAAGHGVRLVFNSDFHWFDRDPGEFAAVQAEVLTHTAKGNVEAELALPSGAGCGCAYPEDIEDATVDRSNEIIAALQSTAAAIPGAREALAALPRYLVAVVGSLRIGIVHGDAESLAGWGLAEHRLPSPAVVQNTRLGDWFRRAQVRIFASTHTCLPVAQCYRIDGRRCAVINNGAAGMPNFAGDRRGLITRIGLGPPPVPSLYGTEIDGVHLDALPLAYDVAGWESCFLRQWPIGSAAHASYYQRITHGPRFALAAAARHGFSPQTSAPAGG
jgi:hypothetical protein